MNDTDEQALERARQNDKMNLSFRKISLIELGGFGRITALFLNNNAIETICGLDQLACLRTLDLSFNLIKKIEGLDTLSHLTSLSLFHNNISLISGLECCLKLESLSLGANKIEFETAEGGNSGISHLKNHPLLVDLNLSGNPITNQPSYTEVVLSTLPRLKYLDNAKVKRDSDIIFEDGADICNIKASTENYKGDVSIALQELGSWVKSNLDENSPLLATEEESKEQLRDIFSDFLTDLETCQIQLAKIPVRIELQRRQTKIQLDKVIHDHLEKIGRRYDLTDSELDRSSAIQGIMKIEMTFPRMVTSILVDGSTFIKKELQTPSACDGDRIIEKCRTLYNLIKKEERNEKYDDALAFLSTFDDRLETAFKSKDEDVENMIHAAFQSLKDDAMRNHRERVVEMSNISLKLR